MNKQRIAVVGSGIAGLASAWLLRNSHEVTLFEANDCLGGHSHTMTVSTAEGEIPVDTGFIVYNQRNYPLLTQLFAHLDVATQATDMSFGFSSRADDVEYAGDRLGALFAQRRNLLRPRFLGMVRDILRFNRDARAALAEPDLDTLSLGDFLHRQGYGDALRDFYLLPMAAAIWSCPAEQMLAFPARGFLRFFANHGLIDLQGRPPWRTVTGGSRQYVQRMLADLPNHHIHTPVRALRRDNDGVSLIGDNGLLGRFDQVVVATHADQALVILAQPSDVESRLLGAFRYQANRVFLHTDASAMPKRRAVWSSWNHMTAESRDGRRPVSVTYWMNRLQQLPTSTDVFVSLNPVRALDDAKVVADLSYDHPVFDQTAMDAQPLLGQLQGRERIWYCGSYFGYGFHEDALRSAVDVAQRLGATPPWAQAQPPAILGAAA